MAKPVTRIPVGSCEVKLVTEEDKVAGIFEREGAFEPDTLAAWVKACSDGRAHTAIDVGSYSGLFAMSASLMSNYAVAIEAKPENVNRVMKNIVYNRVEVDVIAAAASNYDGTGMLNTNGARNSVASSLTFDAKTHNRIISVSVVKLDSVTYRGKVGAIKIDVEGHEAEVLEGAYQMLVRDRPVVLVETLDDETRKARVIARMPGYQCAGFLDGRNLYMVPAP